MMVRALRLVIGIVLALIAAAIVFSVLGTLWVLVGLPMVRFVEIAYRVPEAGLLAAFFGAWALFEALVEETAWRRWLLVALIVAAAFNCATRVVAWSTPSVAHEIGPVTIALNWVVGIVLAAALGALAFLGPRQHPADT